MNEVKKSELCKKTEGDDAKPSNGKLRGGASGLGARRGKLLVQKKRMQGRSEE